jgi:hypothetical protein
MSRRFFALMLPCLALALAAGCRHAKVIEFDDHFSFNVVKTPSWFPDKKQPLTDAQAEILFNMGRPDFLHFWWRPDGSLISSSDLTGMAPETLSEQLSTMDQSWIYLKEKKEIVFLNNGKSYQSRELSDLMDLVCNYGDPSSRSPAVMAEGRRRETLIWIDRGVKAVLEDGKVVDKSYFPGTGQGTIMR